LVTARTIALKLEFHLLKKEGALLRGVVPPGVQAGLRRYARAKYLVWDAGAYKVWLERRLRERRTRYACALEKGLLSVLTPVWDGTPLKYFRLLAESLIAQNQSSEPASQAEWVILDNGCRNAAMLAFLDSLKRHSWIAIRRSPTNAGIIGGLRLCLEAASGRYILPVDADDWLYPDCLEIVTWWIRHRGYPPLLYSDEDKLIGSHAVQPYFKPEFDPVLLLNSAYIAHLGVIDRKLALHYGAYSDKSTEGSADWDLFARFLVAGEAAAVHIPEVVYSWRMHPESTADDAGSKPYIHSSQRAVLRHYLEKSGLVDKYDVDYSPFLDGSADWWLRRRPVDPWPAVLVSLKTPQTPAIQRVDYPEIPRFSLAADARLNSLAELIAGGAPSENDLVCLLADGLEVDRSDWLWEAVGLFERYPDAAMIGGRVRDSACVTTAAGYVFGFGGGCQCPDRGRPALDPGFFTQMLKQRSVSAVSSQFAVIRAGFLFKVARDSPADASVSMLGAWAGAYAQRTAKRVIYSPYLSGVSNFDWDALARPAEAAGFLRATEDLMPDHRYYPSVFSMQLGQSYHLLAQ
jgi:glycosyltransferase involved in cell wall biosynthesis